RTWRRDEGKEQGMRPRRPAPPEHAPSFEKWKNRRLLQRKRFIREYELADLLLVLSEKAAKTFRVRGFPEEKLFYLPRGVDVERVKPVALPAKFSDVFAGVLIKQTGIQHVLEAWHRLNLP